MGVSQSPVACWNTCHDRRFWCWRAFDTTNNLYGTLMYACCPMIIFEPNGNCFVPRAVT